MANHSQTVYTLLAWAIIGAALGILLALALH